MNHGFGMEAHGSHPTGEHRKPARYLLLIDAGGSTVARLFTDTFVPVGEFDAGSEEVAVMTQHLKPAAGADAPAWDNALEGHSPAERAAAVVYTLDV
ncbi:hypothetical protein [Ideonella sp.]|uniref:hypothetical protein n=1 Tax=Ideonella sp. TaxID=1929293 RepID=UPI002B4A43B6|nr:hypothetical protein [Ideonella sp.]HJV69779.1 hypothetical protein [Ideonella sp.]